MGAAKDEWDLHPAYQKRLEEARAKVPYGTEVRYVPTNGVAGTIVRIEWDRVLADPWAVVEWDNPGDGQGGKVRVACALLHVEAR